jgi:hypothetical protein
MSYYVNKVGSWIISSVLGRYVQELDSDHLEISIREGKVSLRDVEVRPTALSGHQLPFSVTASRIGLIQINIPYNPTASACELSIRDLHLLVDVAGTVLIQSDLSADKPPAQPPSSARGLFGQIFDGWLEQIVPNLKFSIANVHIRIEHTNGGKVVAGGLIIPEISCFTVGPDLAPVFVSTTPDMLLKKLIVSGLSVYMDTNVAHVPRQNFVEAMTDIAQGTHEFILRDFTVTGVLRHPKEGAAKYSNRLDIVSPFLNLSLSRDQYVAYQLIQQEQMRFNLRRRFAVCGPPNRKPASERSSGLWWRYVANCAAFKLDRRSVKIGTVLTFLQSRDRYASEFNLSFANPETQNTSMENLQAALGNDAFVLVRRYAQDKYERSIQRKGPELADEDRQFIEQSPQFSRTGLKVHFKIERFVIDLSQTATMTVGEIDGKYSKVDNHSQIRARLSNLNLVDSCRKPFFTLDGQGAELTFSKDAAAQRTSIDFRAYQPHVVYDQSFVDEIGAFFSRAVTFDSPKADYEFTKLEISQLVETHEFVEMSAHFNHPMLTIPTGIPIQIAMELLSIASINQPKRDLRDSDTFYDQFKINVRGFQMDMSDQTVVSPVACEVSYWRSFVKLNSLPHSKLCVRLDTISVRVNRIQYMTFLAMMNLFGGVTQAGGPLSIDIALEFDRLEVFILDAQNSLYSSFAIDGLDMHFLGLQSVLKVGAHVRDCRAMTGGDLELLALGRNESGNAVDLAVTSDDKMNDIALKMTGTRLLMDIDTITNTVQFFKAPSRKRLSLMTSSAKVIEEATNVEVAKPDDDDSAILKKFASRRTLKLDLQFASPGVVFGAAGERLELIGASVLVSSEAPPERRVDDPDTFYDKLLVQAADWKVMLGDRVLLKPLTADVKCGYSFVNRQSVPKIKVAVTLPGSALELTHEEYSSVIDLLKATTKMTKNDSLLSIPDVVESEPGAPNQSPPSSFLREVRFGASEFRFGENVIRIGSIAVVHQSTLASQSLICDLQKIEVVEGHKDKAQIESVKITKKAEWSLVVMSPVLKFSLEWLQKLQRFFNFASSQSPAKPSPSIRLNIQVPSPKVTVDLKGFGERHSLHLVSSAVKGGLHDFTIDDLVITIDGRTISPAFPIRIKTDELRHIIIDVLDLNIESLDYRFAMDLLNYYRAFYPKPPLPPNPEVWDQQVSIQALHVVLNENSVTLFDIRLSNLVVQQCPLETRVTAPFLSLGEFMSDAPGIVTETAFKASIFQDRRVIELGSDSKY